MAKRPPSKARVQEVPPVPPRPRITLSNGIVLEGRPVPQAVIRRVVGAIPLPVVPSVHIEADDRWEENPSDPDYEEALEKAYSDRLEAAYNAMWAMGTSVVSVPEGMFGPDDEGWIEIVSVAGADADIAHPARRYKEWLTLYAMETAADQGCAFGIAIAGSGVMEREVALAIEYFRGRAQRRADSEAGAKVDGIDGNNLPEPPAGAGA